MSDMEYVPSLGLLPREPERVRLGEVADESEDAELMNFFLPFAPLFFISDSLDPKLL
jgi:hypothetical protein